MRHWRLLSAAFIISSLISSESVFSASPHSVLGKKISNIDLTSASGEPWSLDRSKGAKLVVVAFLGVECPLVTNLYAMRLQRLADDFQSRGVIVVGIDSNLQDQLEKIQTFTRRHNIRFPILRDENAQVADQFAATRTPEVFLLDESRIVCYQGRIDDQGNVGFVKSKPNRDDLKEAITELLSGKTVSVPELPAIGCLIGRRHQSSSTASVTYASHVAKIFQNHCLECHRDKEIGPFSMERPEEVAGWADMIGEVIDQNRMPPWFANPNHGTFSNDARLSEDEKRTVKNWIEAGAPLGDLHEIPPHKAYVEGWNIGTPDKIVRMSEKPFKVPSEGVVPYVHYVVDPGFVDDQWMTACEVRPGNRSVVHHVLVFCRTPGQHKFMDEFNGGLIAAYAPGMPAFQSPPGVARRLPAGSRIVIQMHYTVNGRDQEDLSSVGFKFCDRKTVTQEIEARGANNFFLRIPPNASNHQVRSEYMFREDRLLVNMAPHMHMRGKSFRYEAVYPDGRREVLLDVPRFDFNWQLQYNLSTPKMMPKGTVLKCIAHYDNSASNPANPNPNRLVTFGEQTWDEMMIGWFTAITLPRGDNRVQTTGQSLSLR